MAQQAGALAPSGPVDFTGMVRAKMPSVVAITTRQMVQERAETTADDSPLAELFRRYRGNGGEGRAPQQQQARQSLGSGFFISQDGYVVTNNHVIENASEIHVILSDRTDVPARLVGRDPSTDIAVLKIEPRPDIAAASWGNSDAMEPGAWTIAIGSPFGLGGTVTVGVLSARSRDIRSGPYDDFLQTDAAINQGNSGGPLFNAAGEVVGVNTAIFSPSGGSVGIGFAVPATTARSVADQLIRNGRVERGYVGLRLQEITPAIARALGRPDDKGVLVAGVEPGGPGEKAGLRNGDVITQIGQQAVESGRDLSRAVAALRPGSQAQLTVQRGGRTQDVTVAVGQRAEQQPVQTGALTAPETGRRLGVQLGNLDEATRRQSGAEGGVVVRQVEPGSPAAENGIRPGDVIIEANNQPVSQPTDVANAWSQAQRDKKPVLLRVRREGQSVFVAVEG
jgi:serine protease Do